MCLRDPYGYRGLLVRLRASLVQRCVPPFSLRVENARLCVIYRHYMAYTDITSNSTVMFKGRLVQLGLPVHI